MGQETLAQAAAAANAQQAPPKPEETDWGTQEVTDWANEPAPGMGAGAPGVAAAAAPKYQVNDDWSAQQAPVQASLGCRVYRTTTNGCGCRSMGWILQLGLMSIVIKFIANIFRSVIIADIEKRIRFA